MFRLPHFFVLTAFLIPGSTGAAQGPRPSKTLPAFRSDKEIVDWLHQVAEARQRRAEAAANCKAHVDVNQLEPTPDNVAIITGRVTEVAGSGIANAVVAIQPLGVATVTRGDGSYRLSVRAESLAVARRLALTARMIGYFPLTRSIKVAPHDSLSIDISLCQSNVQLQQVTAAAATIVDGAPGAEFSAKDQSITNTQTAGVDEGGIVKLHGNYLVILRRGRLFTVAIGGNALRPTAAVNAFGPGIDPSGTWYDELLIAGDRVVVVGYSYQRGGTELGVFDLDGQGRLTHRGTYQLHSNDYYSSRNYASRLIGSRLIFYTPLYLYYQGTDPLASLPSMRHWIPGPGSDSSRFERIVTPQRIYRPAGWDGTDDMALHTVTICDLAAPELTCEATVVIGPSGRVFYVSSQAVYVWMSGWRAYRYGQPSPAILCRMPLDGSAPAALGVSGAPTDQFSFLESDDGSINVLVRRESWGDAMWAPEYAHGDAALLRAPLSAFNDGTKSAQPNLYRQLPTETSGTFHNRFVGDYLLYGSGNGWWTPESDGSILYVVRWGNGSRVTRLALPHAIDRIETMGGDAVVVGADQNDLHFTGIRLGGTPQVAQQYTMRHAAQGELRSHGFFYRNDGDQEGILGLPVRSAGRPGYAHLFEGSASILFLHNHDARFDSFGTLAADPERQADDHCKASCVDWYGNARPLFLRGRIFALLGYEVVEGRVSAGEITPVQRVSFAPASVRAVRQ